MRYFPRSVKRGSYRVNGYCGCGIIPAMRQGELLKRIDERLAFLRLSDRKAALRAEVGVDFIRDIRRRDHSPKADKLARLATVLGVPAAYLLDAIAPEAPSLKERSIRLGNIHVKGAVQAGVWREAIEWEGDEWYSLTVPTVDRFPGIERFGLEVRGRSMDRMYPEGTIVMVVRFGDIGRDPEPGERVVTLRRSPETDLYEATLKEYQRDEQGRHILWPRSDDPEFQTAFILGDSLPVSRGYEPMPAEVSAGAVSDSAGVPDIMVAGLVIGSFRPER